MKLITLDSVVPEIFAKRKDLRSDIWLAPVTFERGKRYLVEAASGSGKSSLCSFLYGQRGDYRGRISFDGDDISRFGRGRWCDVRRRELSMLFQELRLFPELTAWENVQIKNRIENTQSDSTIESWFEALGIADKRKARVARMSYGQQQRVALMRALCQPFDFLLLDEPVSHLDEENGRLMCDIILQEASRRGAGIISTSIGRHLDMGYDKVLSL